MTGPGGAMRATASGGAGRAGEARPAMAAARARFADFLAGLQRPASHRVYRSKAGGRWRAVRQGWIWLAALLPPAWLGRERLWGWLAFYAAAMLACWLGADFLIAQVSRVATSPALPALPPVVHDRIELVLRLVILMRVLSILIPFFGFGLYGHRILARSLIRHGFQPVQGSYSSRTAKAAISRARNVVNRREQERERQLRQRAEKLLAEARAGGGSAPGGAASPAAPSSAR